MCRAPLDLVYPLDRLNMQLGFLLLQLPLIKKIRDKLLEARLIKIIAVLIELDPLWVQLLLSFILDFEELDHVADNVFWQVILVVKVELVIFVLEVGGPTIDLFSELILHLLLLLVFLGLLNIDLLEPLQVLFFPALELICLMHQPGQLVGHPGCARHYNIISFKFR
jgi:hypothetical protein